MGFGQEASDDSENEDDGMNASANVTNNLSHSMSMMEASMNMSTADVN